MPPTKRPCPECGEEFLPMHMPRHIANAHSAVDPEPRPDVPDPDAPEPEAPPAPVEPEPTAEEQVPRRPGLMERLRARRGRTTREGHLTPATGERAPRPRGRPRKRLPLDADISDVWAFAGRRLEYTPQYPTGRMLQYQAPAAGVIIDRAIAGTLPDRVVFQPLARNRDKYEDVAFLLAGPLLTFSITTAMQQLQVAIDEGDEDRYNEIAARLQMQREMFSWVLSMMLPRLAVGAKLAAEKKAKRDAVIADAFPELGDLDPVEQLVSMLFTPPTYEEAQNNGKSPDGTVFDADQPEQFQERG